jgi:GNAT superfamily N-acetyltransferase
VSDARPAPEARARGEAPARIRAIEAGDVARVWEMLRGLADYEKLTDYLTGNAGMMAEALFGTAGGGERLRGLVADRGGRLVGYALYFPVYGSFRARWRLHLEDLYVEPAERGSGAGAALLAHLARVAEEGGYYAVDWEVLDWNRPALDFYERLGAHRIAADWYRYRIDGDQLTALAARAGKAIPQR